MHPFEIFILAVGVALDCVAVSASAAAAGYVKSWRVTFRVALFFGSFQAFMPIIGWHASQSLKEVIAAADHWIAFLLLFFVGARMIAAGISQCPKEKTVDLQAGVALPMLAVATSIDSLIVGLSLGFVREPIVTPAVTFGITTGALSLAAILIGREVGIRVGRSLEIAGGVALQLIGLRILLSHLQVW